NLLIADTGTQRVRQVLSSGTIATLTAGLGSPMAVAVDPHGTIMTADAGNHKVVKSVGVGPFTAVAGTGEAGTGPDIQLPLETQLRAPHGICFDRSGMLFVVDTSNHRVLRASPTALVEIAAGNGS